jgi:hypothetical protein
MKNPDTVTASEIGDFVYCPEAWRLAVLGHKSANHSIQQAGTAHHTAKAITETVAGGSIALGRILIAVALLALAAWVLSR